MVQRVRTPQNIIAGIALAMQATSCVTIERASIDDARILTTPAHRSVLPLVELAKLMAPGEDGRPERRARDNLPDSAAPARARHQTSSKGVSAHNR
jgi:hypothetical protein